MNSKVCILMATYNGGQFLQQQLESLRAQTFENWQLLISDDGSQDNTLALLREYAKIDARIKLLPNKKTARGACQNFGYLASKGLETEADYFFFCDQDDVWNKNKIAQQHSILVAQTPNKPILVHHDLEVVDHQLRVNHPSFFDLMHLAPKDITFNGLVGRNEITGCTIACNRSLLVNALPVPASAIMHDWWLALICQAVGEIHLISKTLIKYRQHDHNTIGAKSFWTGLNPLTNWIKGWQRGNQEFLMTLQQAEGLIIHFREQLQLEQQHSSLLIDLQIYSAILTYPPLKRVQLARQNGHLRTNWLLNTVSLIRLFTMPRLN
jgi:rhamnosyltransferase